jgi:hypothetical protein
MVVSVIYGGKEVINRDSIVYTLLRSYCFGVPYELRIGVPNDIKLKIEDEYIIKLENETKKLFLHSITHETIANELLVVFTFVEITFSKMLKNKLPNSFNFRDVSFKDYIKERNNQLQYFAFGLRKKGLLLTETGSIHLQKKIHEKAKNAEAFIIKPLQGYNLKIPNYYNKNGKRTQNGKSDPIFLPFATDEEIKNLDNYLIPAFELWTKNTMYKIADVVKIKDKNYIIMEKEMFIFKKDRKVFLICGKKV